MSQIIVFFSIFIILLYTVANIIVTYTTGYEVSSTLTEQFFQFFGYEILILGGIKISKRATEAVTSIYQMIQEKSVTYNKTKRTGEERTGEETTDGDTMGAKTTEEEMHREE